MLHGADAGHSITLARYSSSTLSVHRARMTIRDDSANSGRLAYKLQVICREIVIAGEAVTPALGTDPPSSASPVQQGSIGQNYSSGM